MSGQSPGNARDNRDGTDRLTMSKRSPAVSDSSRCSPFSNPRKILPMIQYEQNETARTAVENFAFAVGMLEGGNMLSSSQRDCLMESLKILRHLVAGAEKMQLNRECGGDGWWDGWKLIEQTLADRPEIENFRNCV